MGNYFDKPQKFPEPGCFFYHKTYEHPFDQMLHWIEDGRVTDCDCRMLNYCPQGAPPMPPWDEFIRPLLEKEAEQVDWVVPAPTAVPGPDVTGVPWDWRPADMYPWPNNKPEYLQQEVIKPPGNFDPWLYVWPN